MIEPAPKNIAAPTTEPIIRVGLVISEDRQQNIFIGPGQLKLNGSLAAELENSEAEICCTSDNKLLLKVGTDQSRHDRISLQTNQTSQLQTASGIALHPVIAGRNFHWRKHIRACYPGLLEFRNHNGSLEVVNQLTFEDYLACVITSEMAPECPAEFMKAQIIAARSWACVFLKDKHAGQSFDVCNDDDCQRYQGSSFLSSAAIQAARETTGMFLVYQDNCNKYVLPAYYIKTCGGFTENSRDIFGFTHHALQSQADRFDQSESGRQSITEFIRNPDAGYCCAPAAAVDIGRYLGKVDQGGTHFRWSKKLAQKELIQNLTEKCCLTEIASVTDFRIDKRSAAGRILSLTILYQTSSGLAGSLTIDSQYKIREVLDRAFLPSSAFIYKHNTEGDFELEGAGWGHGTGMCQVGGVMLALQGKSHVEILKHYFPTSEIIKSY